MCVVGESPELKFSTLPAHNFSHKTSTIADGFLLVNTLRKVHQGREWKRWNRETDLVARVPSSKFSVRVQQFTKRTHQTCFQKQAKGRRRRVVGRLEQGVHFEF